MIPCSLPLWGLLFQAENNCDLSSLLSPRVRYFEGGLPKIESCTCNHTHARSSHAHVFRHNVHELSIMASVPGNSDASPTRNKLLGCGACKSSSRLIDLNFQLKLSMHSPITELEEARASSLLSNTLSVGCFWNPIEVAISS